MKRYVIRHDDDLEFPYEVWDTTTDKLIDAFKARWQAEEFAAECEGDSND